MKKKKIIMFNTSIYFLNIIVIKKKGEENQELNYSSFR